MTGKTFRGVALILSMGLVAGLLTACPNDGAGKDFDPESLKFDAPDVLAGPDSITWTLEGTVFRVTDGAGAAAAAGVKVGDAVAYEVEVDFQTQGYVVDSAQPKSHIFELEDTAKYDYFLSDLLSAPLLSMVDAGFFTAETDISEMHFGRNRLDLAADEHGTASDPEGVMHFGSNNATVTIGVVATSAVAWTCCTNGIAVEEIHDAAGRTTQVMSSVRLASVNGSPCASPCPDPNPNPNPVTVGEPTQKYTFQGAVFLIEDDAGAAAGVTRGAPITYEVLVNPNGRAYVIDNNDHAVLIQGSPYFLAEFGAGSLIQPVNGGSFNGPHDLKAMAIGINRIGDGTFDNPAGRMWVGSANDTLAIVHRDQPTSAWAVGTQVYAVEMAYDDDGNKTNVYTLLTLTSIEPYTAP